MFNILILSQTINDVSFGCFNVYALLKSEDHQGTCRFSTQTKPHKL